MDAHGYIEANMLMQTSVPACSRRARRLIRISAGDHIGGDGGGGGHPGDSVPRSGIRLNVQKEAEGDFSERIEKVSFCHKNW